MNIRAVFGFPALLSLAALTGCAPGPPPTQATEWRPIGANDANLAAMVVDPLDLVNGVPSLVADGSVTANAVARYRANKLKALLDSGVSTVTATGSGTPAAAAAGPD
jgi:hypothetical protein